MNLLVSKLTSIILQWFLLYFLGWSDVMLQKTGSCLDFPHWWTIDPSVSQINPCLHKFLKVRVSYHSNWWETTWSSLIPLGWLANDLQGSTEYLLSPRSHSHYPYRHAALSGWLLPGLRGSRLSFSRLHRKHFADPIIFPAPKWSFDVLTVES